MALTSASLHSRTLTVRLNPFQAAPCNAVFPHYTHEVKLWQKRNKNANKMLNTFWYVTKHVCACKVTSLCVQRLWYVPLWLTSRQTFTHTVTHTDREHLISLYDKKSLFLNNYYALVKARAVELTR